MGTIDFSKMDKEQKLAIVLTKAPHLHPIVEAVMAWREQNPQVELAVVTTYFDRSGSTEDTNGKPVPASVVAVQLDEFGTKFTPKARTIGLIA